MSWYTKKKKNETIILPDSMIRSDLPIIKASLGIDFLSVEVIRDYRTPVIFYDLKGRKIHEKTLENVILMDSKDNVLYIAETSFNTRYKIIREVYDPSIGFSTNIIEEIKEDKEDQVKVKDVYIKGEDNVTLHAFLLTKSDRPKAVVVYGYGGFRIPILPGHNIIHRLPLSRLGFSILVTNLRGGNENGEEWHRQGMLLNKKNVFKDFEEFVRFVKGFGGKVITMGSSNGGLLVGATINDIPNLVDCAVIGHPVLDMLRYHKLYVGKYWISEYGDPDKPEFRDYLASYSPYHNIKPGLPNTFVYTGISDDRVHPGHALKYVAKSRSMGNNVLLFVNDTGHAVADPESLALEYSYLLAFMEECVKER